MALHLHNLKKHYVAPDGSVVPVIDVEDLTVPDGEHVALIGTSGSGKTTLLHLIAGIVTPDSGRIVYDLPRVRSTSPPSTKPAATSSAANTSATSSRPTTSSAASRPSKTSSSA